MPSFLNIAANDRDVQLNPLRRKASQSSLASQYTQPDYMDDPAFIEEIDQIETQEFQSTTTAPYRTESMSTTTTLSPQSINDSVTTDDTPTKPGSGHLSSGKRLYHLNLQHFLKRTFSAASETSSNQINEEQRYIHPSTKRRLVPEKTISKSPPILQGPKPMKDNPEINFSLSCTVTCPVIVAHDKNVQVEMDKRHITWGTQLEIAWGVTNAHWKWESVTNEKLDMLRGKTSESAKLVYEVLKGERGTATKDDLMIYAEYDREQAAIMENNDRGLGLQGPWDGVENWYGGQIQQIALLVRDDSSEDGYIVRLLKPKSRKSCRMARILGSRRLLRLRVMKNDITRDLDKINAMLSKKLVICGRVFHALHSKVDSNGKVYMIELNTDYQRNAMHEFGDQYRFSLNDIIDRWNSLRLNCNQTSAKWTTRWALLFSDSIPVVEFSNENILRLDDAYATEDSPDSPANAKTEQIMTDGCSYINMAGLEAIRGRTKKIKDEFSIAVQGRIAGAKGMWILHPDKEHPFSKNSEPMIWIRPSQNKIKFPDNLPRSERIFDLVHLPKVKAPGSLYMQTILNLSQNGVPSSVFKKLVEDSLMEEMKLLSNWVDEYTFPSLYHAVQNAGKIVSSRSSKVAGSHVLGSIYDDDSDEDDDFWEDAPESTMIERNEFSGCPISLFESTLGLLQAGFKPLSCPQLATKLNEILKVATNHYVARKHIIVPSSIEAMLVPDPFGVLKEDEIFFRSSVPFKSPTNILDPHSFEGPAILSRNPTRLASDVHPVKAVRHDQLLSYVDVIVCSVQGPRSIASYLGGGDYDGDKGTLFMDSNLVDSFQRAAPVKEPPNFLEDNFEKVVEQVPDFLRRLMVTAETSQLELHKILLRGLFDARIGKYSNFHDVAVYSYGYNDKETIRLAYMFTAVLDSSKSGLQVKKEVFQDDRKKFGCRKPGCMLNPDEAEKQQNSEDNMSSAKRSPHLGKFILETIENFAEELRDRLLEKNSTKLREIRYTAIFDEDLLLPLREAENVATLLSSHGIHLANADIQSIRDHAKAICDSYMDDLKNFSNKVKKGEESRSRQLVVKDFTRRYYTQGPQNFSGFLPPSLISGLKASVAYETAMIKSTGGLLSNAFAFDMAHCMLCTLKARATKGHTISTIEKFEALKTMSQSLCERWMNRRI